MHRNIRTVAAAAVIGIPPLSLAGTVEPKPVKKKPVKCHVNNSKGKKVWTTKCATKPATYGKPGANGTNGVGVSGKDGAAGANGAIGANGPSDWNSAAVSKGETGSDCSNGTNRTNG